MNNASAITASENTINIPAKLIISPNTRSMSRPNIKSIIQKPP